MNLKLSAERLEPNGPRCKNHPMFELRTPIKVIRGMTQQSKLAVSINQLLLMCSIALITACSAIEANEKVAGVGSQDQQAVKGSVSVATPSESVEQTDANSPFVESALTESLLYELLIANLAINAQEFDLAAESMARAADETQAPTLFESATRFALHAQRYADSVRLGQQWLAQDNNNYLAYLITSVGAVLDNQPDLATALLTQLIELDPTDHGKAYQRIGEVYIQHPAGLKSLQIIKQIVQLQPKVAEAWMLQAAIAQRVRQVDELNAALDNVLRLDKNNPHAAQLKLTMLQQGPLPILQQFADSFSNNNPKAQSFKIAYGRALLRRELNEEALQQFLSILDADPKDTQALYLSARVYHSMDNFEKSIEYFERHLVEKPDDDQSLVYLASALHQLERYEDAEAVVSQIKDRTEQFNIRRQIGIHIEKNNGVAAGIEYLRTIVTTNDKQRIEIFSDLGHMLQRAKQQARAIEILNQGLLAHPSSAPLLYQRALIYIGQKQFAKYEQDMRVLLELDPKNADYVNTLGYSLLIDAQDRLAEAEELINQAYALKPDSPYILDSKGWLEFKNKNFEGALLYLNQAFKLDADPEIAAHLGEVHWTLGDEEKAKSIWLEAQQQDKENESLNSTIERFIKIDSPA